MRHCAQLKLVIVHHHFRPGGVRRVIELAAPHLVSDSPEPVEAVVLVGGERPDAVWLQDLRRQFAGRAFEVVTVPAFGYASESKLPPTELRQQVRDGVNRLLSESSGSDAVIWAHNLGLGRNLIFARELVRACRHMSLPLVLHHHDWWFENRWQHLAGMRAAGFKSLDVVADAILPAAPRIAHAAINQTDATMLQRHFPGASAWLPNPMESAPPPTPNRVIAARKWLRDQLGEDAPVWLLPCRLLRRKNIAEALLLTRWLRPDAWLLTTGGASSAEEQPYADALGDAARAQGWRLRLGVLREAKSRKPSIPDLFAACEAILLTSMQEGFGLPYLEASLAGRPLIARRLANIAPDLEKFGFRFPQAYDELLVDPGLFNWRDEHERQTGLFAEWKSRIPRGAAPLAGKPAVLAAGRTGRAVPFNRLTLTAQLEVLAAPTAHSWERCAALNPFLKTWRERAVAGRLQLSPWPASAKRWLGGSAYARRFWELVQRLAVQVPVAQAGRAAQEALIKQRMRPEFMYPLLWNSSS